METGYRLALHGSLELLAHTTQDHLLRGGTARSGLGPTTPVTNQEHVPWNCL